MGNIFPIGSATGGAPFEAVSWGGETMPAAIVAKRDVVDGTYLFLHLMRETWVRGPTKSARG